MRRIAAASSDYDTENNETSVGSESGSEVGTNELADSP